MNKVSNPNDDYEMADDYSELLEEYDFSKAVRGKYHQQYRRLKGKIPVNITSKDGDRHIILRTVEAKAIITPDGKLTAQLECDITPGEYRVTLIIEEPVNPQTAEISEEINREKDSIENSA